MAHNLYQSTAGQYSMFYNSRNGKPWHGLGQPVNGATDWNTAMTAAGLDWTVSKHQLSGPTGLVPAWGMFRDTDHAFLGSVGNVYTAIQNQQAFDFVDTLLELENGAHYESAGALGNGERIWCLARVNHDFSIAGTDDKHETYVMFTTSHDGSESATCKLTTVRVVCQNTLNQALGQGGMSQVRIRHSQSGTDKLEAAKKMMTGVNVSVGQLSAKLNDLALRRMDKASCRAVMDRVFGAEWKESARSRNQVEDIARLFESNDRNAFPEIKGTAYNLLNAMTEYSDHCRSTRHTDSRQGLSDAQILKQGALFEYDNWKDKALASILELTKDAPRKEQTLTMATGSSVSNILSMVA